MQNHDIEIEITKEGKVRATIRGVKGAGCLEYAKLLESIIGPKVDQELTAEYYEPGPNVQVRPTLRNTQGR